MSEQKNEKGELVPRLRFPGFQDAWASSSMSHLYSFKGNNSLSRDKLNYEVGEFRNIHYGDIHTKFALHFRVDAERVPYINAGESHSTIRPENYCMAGDMVFADASEDMADIGKAIEIIDVGDLPLVAGLHTILARPNDGSFALGFGAYLFASEGVRKQIQREAQGAKVLGLSASRLCNVQLHYPREFDEQQKIADCLSSLDELIAAESQKLTTLKTHKKGLMQQLFPREGETVPRLRFPEFREAGEWTTESLSKIARITQGGTPSTSVPEYWNGEVQWITPAEMGKDVSPYISRTVRALTQDGLRNCSSELLPEGSIILSTRAPIGHLAINTVPMAINQGCRGIVVNANHDSKFVYYHLGHSRSRLEDIGAGNTFKELSGSALKEFVLCTPTKAEQQKIADSLSSLDDLITAQTKKIAALKTHKKGLMQQLFPVLDEVQP